MKVTIVNDGRTGLHVHKPECRDLGQPKYRGGSRWDADATSLQAVVADIYPPDDFSYDLETEWQEFAGDVRIYPCVGELPTLSPEGVSA